ncbi:hypothetical protein IJ798_00740 [Candidatus Saccharibacteria bacterium]|nr:hypothetical protein [Candidatus Saccharibacteria bacterium]
MQNTNTTQETLNVPETGLIDNVTATAGVMFAIFAISALLVVALSMKTAKADN